MNWSEILAEPWMPRAGMTEAAAAGLVAAAPFALPEIYLDLLRWSDGGEGLLGEVYFQLWPAEEAVRLNGGYEIGKSLPGVWAVGDDSAHFYALEWTGDGQVVAMRFPVGFVNAAAIGDRSGTLGELLRRVGCGELG